MQTCSRGNLATPNCQLAIPIEPQIIILISVEPFLCLPARPHPSSSMPSQHTLNSSLRPSSRQSTHGPHHEVLKHQIAIPTRLCSIMAEIRDLVCVIIAAASEWALERTCRVDFGRRAGSVLRRSCAEAADDGEMCPGERTQRCARAGGECCHCCCDCEGLRRCRA
jgi:hypothetical protein